jgi:hypothetical protein
MLIFTERISWSDPVGDSKSWMIFCIETASPTTEQSMMGYMTGPPADMYFSIGAFPP